jgi:hypothetical protein
MKTIINISGQISGNQTLRNAILTHDAEEERSGFNGYKITFPTKKAAKKALWYGFKYLRSTLDNPSSGIGGLRYSKFGSLYYDASKAEME